MGASADPIPRPVAPPAPARDAVRAGLGLLALSAAVTALLFFWEGRSGLGLSDEGYLWYGAQRVALGEVPLRDFLSYDPGRYYWAAAGLALWGDGGILGVRLALAAFQALALLAGLWLVAPGRAQAGRDRLPYLLAAAAILAAWMLPRHKLFDIGVCLFLVAAFAALVRRPAPARYFLAGLAVGLAAVFGRNHGVYGLLGAAGLAGWLAIAPAARPQLLRGVALGGLGVAAGYLPVLAMLALVPGFAQGFFESLRLLAGQGATNLSLPVPWPWSAAAAGAPAGEVARQVVLGSFFLALPVAAVLGAGWAVACRLRDRPVAPALVAGACLSLPYAHFAFSRADLPHLAQGIFPVLVMALVLIARAPAGVRWAALAALGLASALTVPVAHPGWQCRGAGRCVPVEVSGERLRVDPATARAITLLRRLAQEHAPGDTQFLVVPYWPGAYALLQRRSPTWEIYPLFGRTEAFERREIERLRASSPGFVLVDDAPLDADEARTYRSTHPLTHRYIVDNFDPVPGAGETGYRIYRRRAGRP